MSPHAGGLSMSTRFLELIAAPAIADRRQRARLLWRAPCAPLVTTAGIVSLDLVAAILSASAVHAQPATNGPQSALFSASPTSGPAPLTVKFCSAAGIGIDFGDGKGSGMGVSSSGECPAGMGSSVTHVYTVPGTYQLRGSPCPGSPNSRCGEAADQANTVTITVTPAR
jgi:hypothetical protein